MPAPLVWGVPCGEEGQEGARGRVIARVRARVIEISRSGTILRSVSILFVLSIINFNILMIVNL